MVDLVPMMQSFSGLTLLTLMFSAAAIVLVATNHTVDRSARYAFLCNLVVLALIAIADWINIVPAHGIASMRTFHLVSMSLTFAVAPVLPVIIANTIFPERNARIVFFILAGYALFELSNIFFPTVFVVDASNSYARGPLYWVYMSSYFVSSVYLTVESIKASTTYQAASTISVVAILLCMLGGVAIQIVNPALRMSWPAAIMAVVLYFQFYTEMTLRTDALTMLLNRHGYEEFLDHPSLPCIVVLVDVDDFKHVNDTYGHEYGDVALHTIAQSIRKSFGNSGLCYRIGGDEFAVIVTKESANMESLMKKLDRTVAKARDADTRLPGVSVGYAEAPTNTDVHEAINKADSSMYANKRAKKSHGAD